MSKHIGINFGLRITNRFAVRLQYSTQSAEYVISRPSIFGNTVLCQVTEVYSQVIIDSSIKFREDRFELKGPSIYFI